MRKGRRLGGVARDEAESARVDPGEDRFQARDVHHLVQAVRDRLAHERMVRNLAVARDRLETRVRIREDGREKILRLHPLEVRRGP